MSTTNTIELWTRLATAWGGQSQAVYDPNLPFRVVSRFALRMANGEDVGQIVAVFLVDDPRAESLLPQFVNMADASLRDRLRSALGYAIPVGSTELLSLLGLSWDEAPASWLTDLQAKQSTGLKLLAYAKPELEQYARQHLAIYEEFFGTAAQALAQARTDLQNLRQDNTRLKHDVKRYEHEFNTVASIRRRLEQAQAWQETLSITQHKLSTKIGFLKGIIDRHRVSQSWDQDVFDKLHKAVDELQDRLAMLEGRGSSSYDRREYTLAELVSEIEALANANKLKLTQRNKVDGQRHIEVDLKPLQDCVEELIHNAKYWTRDRANPRIELILRIRPEPSVGDMLEIHCQDNGPGVEDSDKLTIFEPFITDRKDGKGLGLHMIRRFCELHQGEAYENGKYKQGANFVMRLPLKTQESSNE